MEPKRYRKKPVVIEAMQVPEREPGSAGKSWYVHEVEALAAWLGHAFRGVAEDKDGIYLYIAKSNATVRVRGDAWVIAERDGVGFYPCIATEFYETYEPAE